MLCFDAIERAERAEAHRAEYDRDAWARARDVALSRAKEALQQRCAHVVVFCLSLAGRAWAELLSCWPSSLFPCARPVFRAPPAVAGGAGHVHARTISTTGTCACMPGLQP